MAASGCEVGREAPLWEVCAWKGVVGLAGAVSEVAEQGAVSGRKSGAAPRTAMSSVKLGEALGPLSFP
jgi:hypothetical protein